MSIYGRKTHLIETIGFSDALRDAIKEFYLVRINDGTFGHTDHSEGGLVWDLFKLDERNVRWIVERAISHHLPRHMYLEDKFSEEAHEIINTKFELKHDHYKYILTIPKEEVTNEERS